MTKTITLPTGGRANLRVFSVTSVPSVAQLLRGIYLSQIKTTRVNTD